MANLERNANATNAKSAALAAEIAGYRTLVGLLQAEQDALRVAHADALPEIAAAKLREVDHLSALARSRDSALKGGENQEHGAAWDELRGLAADARRMNDSNGRMIAVQQHHFDRALSALWHAAGVTPLYGADGRPQGGVSARTFAAI